MQRNPPDPLAPAIRFGVETETFVSRNSGIAIGQYHNGPPVHDTRSAWADPTKPPYQAPTFAGQRWRAERDGSIVPDAPDHLPCEFVSPVLHGEPGLLVLCDFLEFARKIRAKTNSTCGCHITVSVPSVIGTSDPKAIALFVRKLTRIVHHFRWAIYGQTGQPRHQSTYCAPFQEHTMAATNAMMALASKGDTRVLKGEADGLGRGIVNMLKLFPADPAQSCVEFRAFASTLSRGTLLHHLATVLGLCRLAHTTHVLPRSFCAQSDAPICPVSDLVAMWRTLGWIDAPSRSLALGQFGILYHEHPSHSQEALLNCRLFAGLHFPHGVAKQTD